MRIAHVLSRCQSAEWRTTDTTLVELLDGLRENGVDSVVYYPGREKTNGTDPIVKAGHPVHHFRTFLPIWGLPDETRQELMLTGDTMMSFDLFHALRSAPALDVIHTHSIGLVGALCQRAAHARGIPCVVTLPDEELDLPKSEWPVFTRRPFWSCNWGKLPAFLLRAGRLLGNADAVITSCRAEIGLLREKFPWQRFQLIPNGISMTRYQTDCRARAMKAFPEIEGRKIILCLARIEPSRNQQWLLYQLPVIQSEYPNALVVFVGPCTNAAYGQTLLQCIAGMRLHKSVLITGSLPFGDPRLIGLMQQASVLVLPSIIEPSGSVVAEAWAAGLPVVASRTSGTSLLIHHDSDGWLFDLSNPHTLQEALRLILSSPKETSHFVEGGYRRVRREFDNRQLAGKMKKAYDDLIDVKFTAHQAAEQKRREKLLVKVFEAITR